MLSGNIQFQQACSDTLSAYQESDSTWWFRERIHHGWGQAIRIDDFKLHKKTKFQTLDIFYNNDWGHVMLLDGAVQIVEKDWRAYQEMLVGCSMLPHYTNPQDKKNILIIGGGDGGVANIVLNFFPQAHVTMIDIDGDVIEASKQFFPEISSLLRHGHPNFKLIIDDGAEFVSNTMNKSKFDVAIVDCTDPTDEGPAKGLFGTDFQKNLKDCLKQGGIVIQQSGCLAMQWKEVKETHDIMKSLYKHPFVTRVEMLTYPGTMTLVGGSDIDIRNTPKEQINTLFSQVHKLSDKAEYFNPDIFFAAFTLPHKYQRLLNPSQNTPIHTTRSYTHTRFGLSSTSANTKRSKLDNTAAVKLR